MIRQLGTALFVLAFSAQLWAQSDTIRFRDPRTQDATGTVNELTYKKVKYSQFINGEFAGTQEPVASDIREVILGADHKNSDFSAGEEKMNEGAYDEAIARFERSLRSPKTDPGKQQARINIVRCHVRAGSVDKAIAAAQEFRKEMPNSYYVYESYFLQYEAYRMKGDLGGMERTLNELGNAGVPDWKNSAEILNAELYEMQGKYAQALPIYTKNAGDPGVGKQAKLGEMRCLSAMKNWANLKSRADAILSGAKDRKFDEQLLTGAYNARGDVLLSSGKAKEALYDYMRGVLVLNTSGEPSREHEAAIAKAAIACARYAGELRDQEKATYKQRAKDLQGELDHFYPKSPWMKDVNEAIQAAK